MNKSQIDKILRCAVHYPAGVNKLTQVGLRWYSSEKLKTPRIREAKAWTECILREEKKLGDHVVLYGEVVSAEVADDVVRNDEVMQELINAPMHIGKDKFAVDFKIVKYKRYD
jgi:flavin reductase (DIM6/NTAB) family NADH-FMN oxidoreductase RutF